MKVVPLNSFADVKSQENPPTRANVTEIPPTPPTQRPQDKRSLNVSGAAAYRNPEASITSDISKMIKRVKNFSHKTVVLLFFFFFKS